MTKKIFFLLICILSILIINGRTYETVLANNNIIAGEEIIIKISDINLDIIKAGLKDISTGIEYDLPFSVSKRNDDLFAKLTFDKTGEYNFYFVTFTGKFFDSNILNIQPAALNDFSIKLSSAAIVNQPFRVSVTAKDKFDNVVDNYDNISKGFYINTTSGASVYPTFISSLTFFDGVSEFSVVFTDETPTQLIFSDDNNGIKVYSDTIYFDFGELKYFKVESDSAVNVNKPFTIKISAYDAFNNLFKLIDNEKRNFNIEYSGSGNLTLLNEDIIFHSGSAELTFVYDKVEEIDITITDYNSYIGIKTDAIDVIPGKFSQIEFNYEFITINQVELETILLDMDKNFISNFNDYNDTIYITIYFNDGNKKNIELKNIEFENGKNKNIIELNNLIPFYLNIKNNGFIGLTTKTIINPFIEKKHKINVSKFETDDLIDLAGSILKLDLVFYDEFMNITTADIFESNYIKIILNNNLFYDEIIVETLYLKKNNNTIYLYYPGYYDENINVDLAVLDNMTDTLSYVSQLNIEKNSNQIFVLLTFSSNTKYKSFFQKDNYVIEIADIYMNTFSQPYFIDDLLQIDNNKWKIPIDNDIEKISNIFSYKNLFILVYETNKYDKYFIVTDNREEKKEFKDDYLNFLNDLNTKKNIFINDVKSLNKIRRHISID